MLATTRHNKRLFVALYNSSISIRNIPLCATLRPPRLCGKLMLLELKEFLQSQVICVLRNRKPFLPPRSQGDTALRAQSFPGGARRKECWLQLDTINAYLLPSIILTFRLETYPSAQLCALCAFAVKKVCDFAPMQQQEMSSSYFMQARTNICWMFLSEGMHFRMRSRMNRARSQECVLLIQKESQEHEPLPQRPY